MGFWELMVKKDNKIVALANLSFSLIEKLSMSNRKSLKQTKVKFHNKFHNEEVYIILNGPSLKKQDVSVLKGKTTMFVNRGFLHPLYKELKPLFHVIVDPKFKTGVWPVTWLDEILEMNPKMTFVMPVSWSKLEILQPYIKKGVSFFWLSNRMKFSCLGVSGSCFQSTMYMGFKNIYFTGFDANGIAYELINHQSHFYGTNEENNSKNTSNYVIDMYMHSRHLNDLTLLANKSKKEGYNIVNLTEGGLLDMFPRNSIKQITSTCLK